MTRLKVAVIVEGHGEQSAVPKLLERIWYELLGGEFIDVIRPPIRRHRQRIARNHDQEIEKAVEFAARKLAVPGLVRDPELILILIDADDDPPCVLGPKILQIARTSRKDKRIACVLANVEFESWFVAAAESLREYLEIDDDERLPDSPERLRLGKAWISKRFRPGRYSETVDQVRLTSKMDLSLCRKRSPSFDKLCREFQNCFDSV